MNNEEINDDWVKKYQILVGDESTIDGKCFRRLLDAFVNLRDEASELKAKWDSARSYCDAGSHISDSNELIYREGWRDGCESCREYMDELMEAPGQIEQCREEIVRLRKLIAWAKPFVDDPFHPFRNLDPMFKEFVAVADQEQPDEK